MAALLFLCVARSGAEQKDQHRRTGRLAELQRISPRWLHRDCIVAAPGPSLTPSVARDVRIARMAYGWKVIVVQDAYKAIPYADALYGCCPKWWRVHKHCEGFHGEKWTTHEGGRDSMNNKLDPDGELGVPIADAFDIKVVRGAHLDTFSSDPEIIHYGSNSGFQAINLALLFGCRRIVLVGYDMRYVGDQAHFFGNHPKELHQNRDTDYRRFVPRFERAVPTIPKGVVIYNATPGSALTCFPMMSFEDATSAISSPHSRLHRDWPVADDGAGAHRQAEGIRVDGGQPGCS